MAGLKVKIGADTTALGAGMRRARGMVGGFGAAIKGIGLAGASVGLGAMAAGLVGVGVGMRGVKGALDLGGTLSDLSARTGIAVKDLVILQQAFADNGIAAAKVGPIINKMQKSIADAGDGMSAQVKAFNRLGMSYDDLAGKSPEQQFAMIQKGLAGVRDETLRTATAMDIFGKSGGELKVLFADTSALGNAKQTIGTQADILARNATAFDRSSDLLAGMGKKLQGLFVGIADYVNPVLLPVLEKLNKLDLAKYGQAAGRFIALIAEAFKQDAIPGLLGAGMILAGKAFINSIALGFQGAVASMWAGLKNIPSLFSSAFAILTDSNLWNGLGMLAGGLGLKMGAAFMDLLPEKLLEAVGAGGATRGMNVVADTAMRIGSDMVGRARPGDLSDDLKNHLKLQMDAFRNAYSKDGPLSGEVELKSINDTLAKLRESLDAGRKESSESPAMKDPSAGTSSTATKAGRIEAPRIQSLAAVGGASLTRRSVDLARERNNLLVDIKRNTARAFGMTARFA